MLNFLTEYFICGLEIFVRNSAYVEDSTKETILVYAA